MVICVLNQYDSLLPNTGPGPLGNYEVNVTSAPADFSLTERLLIYYVGKYRIFDRPLYDQAHLDRSKLSKADVLLVKFCEAAYVLLWRHRMIAFSYHMH